MKQCTGIFDHSLDKMKTVHIDKDGIVKECSKCGYWERLPRSQQSLYFHGNLIQQKKKWDADDNRKELLQPWLREGGVNPEYTEAYGTNPLVNKGDTL